ncbi:hypothetical protein CU098_006207, partial [Rhizopus stolonifer]
PPPLLQTIPVPEATTRVKAKISDGMGTAVRPVTTVGTLVSRASVTEKPIPSLLTSLLPPQLTPSMLRPS